MYPKRNKSHLPTNLGKDEDALGIGDFCFPVGLPSKLVPSCVAKDVEGIQLSDWNELEVTHPDPTRPDPTRPDPTLTIALSTLNMCTCYRVFFPL
jgi:hypothetical protein